ncbi:MAG: carboxypeptidase-like regulatory domain-containing protein [Eudoraea sp.]|uniref:carboxypeptidase-like regulatory domain-containing protein n=1 Tax=Eudoraea sp. TaxID=1979955 RepID=UPI003C722C04
MKNLALVFSLFITTLMFSQQQGAVAGTILDKEMNNEPLLFANINIKNTPTTVQTNFHGNFEIDNINPGEYTLVVSYLGYETIEVPIIIEENKTTQIINGLETKKISLQDIARLQRVSEEPVYITASSEQSSRK